jgi:hypothetical protein
MSLSKRLRPDVEAAPWVIEEVKEMEALLSEARDVIRDEVEDNYPWKDKYPMHMLRYKADMDIVRRIDAALAGKEDKP